MQEVHLYIETDSFSPRPIKRRYGYVLEYQAKNGKLVTAEDVDETEGTYHQATLEALVVATMRLKSACKLYIHAQDEFVLGAIENYMPRWVEQDFMTARGTPVAHRDEWKCLWPQIREHEIVTVKGSHAYSTWLQGEMKRLEERNV